MDDAQLPQDTPHGYPIGRLLFVGLMCIMGIFLWYLYNLGIIAPPRYATPKTIIIEQGMTAESTGRLLEREGVIRNTADFLLYLKLTGNDRAIKPGLYVFRDPLSVPRLVRMIAGNVGELAVTLVEGWTNEEMARALERTGVFSHDEFARAAAGKEGYLFPDTYRLFLNATPESFVDRLEKRFQEKINPLMSEIERSHKSLSDIVIMASLIEKESFGDADRAIISGILWKRLERDIPLQVDATLSYLTGRESKDLTKDDLRLDSPYNTYRYKGLPKGPIGNPGLKALDAAIHPAQTAYLFYLHDADGVAHFARTFEEHKKNKERYLK